MMRLRIAAAALAALGVLSLAPAASATPVSSHHADLGVTQVKTAPGIALTLVRAGIVPLPELPRTGFSLSFDHGLQVTYAFPITSSTVNLAAGTGDVKHDGGILFVSRRAHVGIGGFDIDLAAGTVFATRVNGKAARVPILDLDLSRLQVTTTPGGDTVLSRIGLDLDPAAAGVLNSTFGISLPTDGSLRFGSGRVTIKG